MEREPIFLRGVMMVANSTNDERARTITARRLTQESFREYGDVLSFEESEPLPIDLYGDDIAVRRQSYFESDQPVEFLITRSRVRDLRVQFLERHVQLTQTFLPLGGQPFLMVVGHPDAADSGGVPDLAQVEAFLVPGRAGIKLHRGTWHELPFPLEDGSVHLVTSHRALTEGLEDGPAGRGEIHDRDVEKRNLDERLDFELRVTLP